MSEKQKRAWRHNALIGAAAMAKSSLRTILASDTLTREAREQADKALSAVWPLEDLLRTRVDPEDKNNG